PATWSAQVLGTLRVVGYPATDTVRYVAGSQQIRATGTSIDPNVLGGMLILAIPLGLTQALSPAPLLRRRWFLAASAVMVVALALTFSRGSWAGFVASLLFIGALRYRRLWLLLVLLAALLLIAPQGAVLLDRFSSGVTFQDQAAAMRL